MKFLSLLKVIKRELDMCVSEENKRPMSSIFIALIPGRYFGNKNSTIGGANMNKEPINIGIV